MFYCQYNLIEKPNLDMFGRIRSTAEYLKVRYRNIGVLSIKSATFTKTATINLMQLILIFTT